MNHHLSERLAVGATFTLAVIVAFICAFGFEVYSATHSKADGSKWSGCYLGGGGQYSMLDSKASEDVAGLGSVFVVDGLGAQGYGLYGKVGCDVLLMPKIVVGVFGDYSWHNSTDFTVTEFMAPGDLVKASLKSDWAVGGRAGYLATPDALVYVLAGYSQAKVSDITGLVVGTPAMSVPNLKGYVVGAGIDVGLGKGWFAEAEGRFYNYDKVAVGTGPDTLGLDTDVLTARVGLAYKFNFGEQNTPFVADHPLK